MFKLILDVLGLIRSSRRMAQYSLSLGNILQPWVTYYRPSGQYCISVLICAQGLWADYYCLGYLHSTTRPVSSLKFREYRKGTILGVTYRTCLIIMHR